jgi:2-octaprenyl-6-methoxyphenol hydroxylase
MATIDNNIIILGGGFVGASLALALLNKGVGVALIEKASSEQIYSNFDSDGRGIAINFGSKLFLENLNVWQEIEKYAQPVSSIRTFELNSAWTLDYDNKIINNEPLCYIVESFYIKKAIWNKISEYHKNKKFNLYLDSSAVEINFNDFQASVKLNSGEILSGSLLVGADGRNSMVRKNSDISSKSWDYNQKALTAQIFHEKPHQNIAWEVFTQHGAFAILPMTNCVNTNQNRSGIVWIKPKKFAWNELDVNILEADLEEIFPYYGKISFASERYFYELSAMTVNKNFYKRSVIIGDAAHFMHPIAGQGLNLGWRDAKILSKMITDNHGLGIDVGSELILKSYNRKRFLDQKSFMVTTDILNKLFLIDNSFVKMFREFGLGAINKIPFVKNFFIKKAIGI